MGQLLQKEAVYRKEIETKKLKMEKEYNSKLAKINEDGSLIVRSERYSGELEDVDI